MWELLYMVWDIPIPDGLWMASLDKHLLVLSTLSSLHPNQVFF
jgi:hypothetical protein